MDRRDIEFNAEGVILRGWLYRGEGASGQTWATCSVNVCRGHDSTRRNGRSRGRVSTHSFRDVDLTAPVGHRAASGSAVTSCTIFAPAAERAIRSTARPSSPNRHDASSLPLTTARGSSSRCSKTQRGSRRCGPPSFRRAEQAQPQVARSRSKSRQTRQTPLRRPRHAHRRPTLATRNLVARREDLTRYKSGTFQ